MSEVNVDQQGVPEIVVDLPTSDAATEEVTKDYLRKKYGKDGKELARNTVRSTLEACGCDTSQRVYSSDVEVKFAAARRMIEEQGMTYEDVAEHFKVGAKVTDSGETLEDLVSGHAAGGANGGDGVDVAFQVADAIATQEADVAVSMVPTLLAIHLKQRMSDGSLVGEMDNMIQAMRRGGPEGNVNARLRRGLEQKGMLAAAPQPTALLEQQQPLGLFDTQTTSSGEESNLPAES